MRRDAGLGTCNCCDYFIMGDGTTILIEETRLTDRFRNLNEEYHYLSDPDRREFVHKHLRNENRLKVYGSMLVLCRLAAACDDAQTLLVGRKYDFWLVASGMYETEDMRFFDSMRDELFGELRGVLTGNIVSDVKIIPSAELVTKLSEYVATS